MLINTTSFRLMAGAWLILMLSLSLSAQGQPPRGNPWAYSPEQQRHAGQRPWGETPSSANRAERPNSTEQQLRQNDQPCNANIRSTPVYPGMGYAPGYYGYSDPYLGMPHGLPGAGRMNPLYPVDPYMGWY